MCIILRIPPCNFIKKGIFEYFDNEWAMLLVIPFILLYNGKRGINNASFSKYMFYVVYPVHLWILMILNFVFN